MKTSFWAAAMGIVLVSAVIAWVSFNSARANRVAMADVAAKRAALAVETNGSQTRMALAERDQADLRAALNSAQTEADRQAAAATSAKANTVRPPDRIVVLEAHPELRGLFRQDFQGRMKVDYLPFYNSAGLTAEQRKKFEELMLEAEEQRMDLQATARSQGLGPMDSSIVKIRQQREETLQAAQKELLGAAGFEQLQDFKQAEPQNKFVNNCVYWVDATTDPFTELQREKLLKVLATSVRQEAGGTAKPPVTSPRDWQAKLQATDWPRVYAEVQAFLSPAQVAAVKANSMQPQFEALIREFCVREGIPVGR